jgi:hypothetical protein
MTTAPESSGKVRKVELRAPATELLGVGESR